MTESKSVLEKMREDERAARKDIIVDAAVRLFSRIPFKQVGMRDIAAEAGLSAASIYRYFSDRDELFLEALLRESRTIAYDFEKIIEQDDIVEIEKAALEFVEYLIDNEAFFQMMTHFMVDGGLSGRSLEKFNSAERRIIDYFEIVFKKLGADDNSRLLSHAFFASLNGIVITFRNYPGREDRETRKHMLRLASLIAEIFSKGAI